MPRPTTALLHVDALRHNLAECRRRAPRSRLMAMVKADGYGHGLEAVGRALVEADGFGVASLGDARRLRDLGEFDTIILLEAVSAARDAKLELLEARLALAIKQAGDAKKTMDPAAGQKRPAIGWLLSILATLKAFDLSVPLAGALFVETALTPEVTELIGRAIGHPAAGVLAGDQRRGCGDHRGVFPCGAACQPRLAVERRSRLPDGDRLTVRRLQTLGIDFGMGPGFERIHWLFDEALVGGRLSDTFLEQVMQRTSYADNPLFVVMQESIYGNGQGATGWAAERRTAYGNFPGPGQYAVCAVNTGDTRTVVTIQIRSDGGSPVTSRTKPWMRAFRRATPAPRSACAW